MNQICSGGPFDGEVRSFVNSPMDVIEYYMVTDVAGWSTIGKYSCVNGCWVWEGKDTFDRSRCYPARES